MFGSRSSRRRPSAKWNIKLTYRWITRVCACVRVCQETSVAQCASIAATYSKHAHGERQENTHIHTFLTYIHYTQTTGCQEGQGNKYVCVYVCVLGGWKSAAALGRESNAKLVLSSCQIIHDPASEMITERLDLSSPRSVSLSLMNHVLFKMSHRAETSK